MDAQAKFSCLSCRRTLYDRSKKKCGYCGADIPEALRHTQTLLDDLGKGKFSEKDRMEFWSDGRGDSF